MLKSHTWLVAYPVGQSQYRTFPSLQKVILDSTNLELPSSDSEPNSVRIDGEANGSFVSI